MRESRRVQVLALYEDGIITSREAVEAMGISIRQFRRLLKRYREEGSAGLAHKTRGKRSKRRTPRIVEERILDLSISRYSNFNDTHFTEKLNEVEGIYISREKVRRIRRKAGIAPKTRRSSPKHRSRREPKTRAGMLLQVDGSQHNWLQGRGPYLVLLSAIDDATRELVYARFENAETSAGYMRMFRSIVAERGMPLSIYGDRHSIFRVNREPNIEEQLSGQSPKTQVYRALQELGIVYTPAYSPQAKGRVERHFRTMQDRLVSELELAGVSSLQEANQLLAGFIDDYNRRFKIEPVENVTAWLPVPVDLDLDTIFCFKEKRTVNYDNTVSYKGRTLQIPPGPKRSSYAKTKVTIYELLNGDINVVYKGETIAKFLPIARNENNDRVTFLRSR
jgi:transposase